MFAGPQWCCVLYKVFMLGMSELCHCCVIYVNGFGHNLQVQSTLWAACGGHCRVKPSALRIVRVVCSGYHGYWVLTTILIGQFFLDLQTCAFWSQTFRFDPPNCQAGLPILYWQGIPWPLFRNSQGNTVTGLSKLRMAICCTVFALSKSWKDAASVILALFFPHPHTNKW